MNNERKRLEEGRVPLPINRLAAVMSFFTLADTGGSEKLPLVTIPAQ